MKKLAVLFISIIVTMCFLSCSGAKAPTEKQMAILVPVSETDKSTTKNGVTVDVQPIDMSNVGLHADLSAKFPIYTLGFLEKQPSPKDYTESNVLAGFSDPPAVTFMLKITNNSGHIIKLNGSDVGITIIGKDWRKLDITKINMGWLNFFKANYPYQQTVPAELSSAIQNIALWDENQKILPGKTVTLYAPFDVIVNRGFGTATLSIYDLVTNTDQAGNPTERTNMDFNFKESTITVK
jgi:hypothetical protein